MVRSNATRIAVTLMFAAGPASAAVLKVTDVSPNIPYLGATSVSSVGRVNAIVIDPNDDTKLYAATVFAGIWKSTNSGQSWTQASKGLRTGLTQWAQGLQLPVLAIDDTDSRRLLYATTNADGRPGFKCFDGFQTTCNFGGLWVSANAAVSWDYIDFDVISSSCSNALVMGVGFLVGRPFVLTNKPNCQLMTTSDPALLLNWTSVPVNPPWPAAPGVVPPSAFSTGVDPAQGPDGGTMFACSGAQTYRKRNPASASPAWENGPGVALPQDCVCRAITAVPGFPTGFPPTQALAVGTRSITDPQTKKQLTQSTVFLVTYPNGPVVPLIPAFSTTVGSGNFQVRAAARPTNPSGQPGPGQSYDVYAGDALDFYHYRGGNWQKLTQMHYDTHGMAFPKAYDPLSGNCAAFAATDGGVSFSFFPPSDVPVCKAQAAEDHWQLASSGLHFTFSILLTGFSRPIDPICVLTHLGSPGQPCPVLYVGSADTDTWVNFWGGIPQNQWTDLGDQLGDSTGVFLDPAQPSLALAMRNVENKPYRLFGSSPGPPGPGSASREITPPPENSLFVTISNGPAPGGIAEVMTLPKENPAQYGDYVAVTSGWDLNPIACGQGVNGLVPACAHDFIVRNLRAAEPLTDPTSTWIPISGRFGPGQIGGIYPSGGHANLTVFVMTSNKSGVTYNAPLGPAQIWRGDVGKDGLIPDNSWQLVSQPPFEVIYNLFVNPFDPNEIYAVDLGDNSIKKGTSKDGKNYTWVPVADLKDVATNHGEFVFDCGSFMSGPYPTAPFSGSNPNLLFQAECSMTGMVFVRDQPNLRVAVLYPGGVAFSRDSGANWIPLDVTNASPADQPVELPNSAFYDPTPNPITGDTSLYIALEGKGVKRVDGPFARLEAGRLTYCPSCVPNPAAAVRSVRAYVPVLDESIPLRLGIDGIWRGDVLFDSGKLPALDYYFMVDGQRTAVFHHRLTHDEAESGVAVLSNAGTPAGGDLKGNR